MTMAWLMGSSAFTRKEIDDQLDADFNSGHLHAMQRDLIRFYLLPFDEKQFDGAYKDLADRFQSTYKAAGDDARKRIADAESKKQGTPADALVIRSWLEMVASKDHKDLVACMIFQPANPTKKDAINVLVGPKGYQWEIWRAREIERIRVDFLVTSLRRWSPTSGGSRQPGPNRARRRTPSDSRKRNSSRPGASSRGSGGEASDRRAGTGFPAAPGRARRRRRRARW